MRKLLCLFSLVFGVHALGQECDLPTPYENGPTGSNMTILLNTTFIQSLNLSSSTAYIVALTTNDMVVGSSCLAPECLNNGMQSIAIWGDDALTLDVIDGAENDEEITLKIVDGIYRHAVVNIAPIFYTTNEAIFISFGSIVYECTGVIEGCMDTLACNYNVHATIENGSCEYPETYYDCDGNCLNDIDADGICDELEILGCIEPMACNYNPSATDQGDCIFPDMYYDCDGNCLNDLDADGICDEEEVDGCTDFVACNYNPNATNDDGSCFVISIQAVYDEQNGIITMTTNALNPEIIWLFYDALIPFESDDTLSIIEDGVYQVLVSDAMFDCGASYTIQVNTVALEEDLSDKLQIFPNPASDYISIGIHEPTLISIYDSHLKMIEQIYTSKEQIHVEHYKSGVYYIGIQEHNSLSFFPWIKE